MQCTFVAVRLFGIHYTCACRVAAPHTTRMILLMKTNYPEENETMNNLQIIDVTLNHTYAGTTCLHLHGVTITWPQGNVNVRQNRKQTNAYVGGGVGWASVGCITVKVMLYSCHRTATADANFCIWTINLQL